jgi:hypothetical protein
MTRLTLRASLGPFSAMPGCVHAGPVGHMPDHLWRVKFLTSARDGQVDIITQAHMHVYPAGLHRCEVLRSESIGLPP